MEEDPSNRSSGQIALHCPTLPRVSPVNHLFSTVNVAKTFAQKLKKKKTKQRSLRIRFTRAHSSSAVSVREIFSLSLFSLPFSFFGFFLSARSRMFFFHGQYPRKRRDERDLSIDHSSLVFNSFLFASLFVITFDRFPSSSIRFSSITDVNRRDDDREISRRCVSTIQDFNSRSVTRVSSRHIREKIKNSRVNIHVQFSHTHARAHTRTVLTHGISRDIIFVDARPFSSSGR